MMTIRIAGCAVLLTLTMTAASLAEEAIPSKTLADMGLGSMQTLSDGGGLAVRGKGTFASVWGTSTARWGNQTSTNSYSAGASWMGKPATASGSTFSFAGQLRGFGRFGW